VQQGIRGHEESMWAPLDMEEDHYGDEDLAIGDDTLMINRRRSRRRRLVIAGDLQVGK
jgi:hypothetical protein